MCSNHRSKRCDKKVANHKKPQPRHKNRDREPKPRQKPLKKLSQSSQLYLSGSAVSVEVAVADALNDLVPGYGRYIPLRGS